MTSKDIANALQLKLRHLEKLGAIKDPSDEDWFLAEDLGTSARQDIEMIYATDKLMKSIHNRDAKEMIKTIAHMRLVGCVAT